MTSIACAIPILHESGLPELGISIKTHGGYTRLAAMPDSDPEADRVDEDRADY
jgi:hypothetical protein